MVKTGAFFKSRCRIHFTCYNRHNSAAVLRQSGLIYYYNGRSKFS